MKGKQKTLLIVLFVCVSLLLVGGGVTAFIINYNLQVAPTVEIIDDGNVVFASTQVNYDYKGYRFRFVNGDNTFYIESPNNVISLTGDGNIEIGEKYSISVCYLGEIEGNNSEYSSAVVWTSYEHLAAPTLEIDEINNIISWNEVPNASYYIVYHGKENERVYDTELNLGNLTGGKKDIFVVAYSDKTYYKASMQSNVLVQVEVYHKLENFVSLAYNSEQFILTIIGKDNLSLINIYINDFPYETTNFTSKRLITGEYEYTINLSAIYHGSDMIRIGASPASQNQYEIFTGEIVYL